MGNQCNARYDFLNDQSGTIELKKPPRESIELNNVEILGVDSSQLPISSLAQSVNEEKKNAIAIQISVPTSSIRKGRPLQGLPVIQPTIKQTWSNLRMFTYSYDSLTEYKSPFRFQDSGEIYYGQWKDGSPQGRGFMYFPTKYLYEGSFKKGLKDGRARILFVSGNLLQGEFREGRLVGQLTFTSPHFYFKGTLQNGLYNGRVKQTTPIYTFKGQYRNGKRCKGQLNWNANSYNGIFDEQGKFHGEGTLRTDIGTYTGQFDHGLKHGQGQFIWKDNLKYKGQYVKGLKQGFGVLYLSDGEVSYQGEWKNNLPHGKGRTYKLGKPQNQVDWFEGIQKEDIQEWSKPLERLS